MPSSDLEKVEALFHKARLLDAADRAAFLDQACSGDLHLRAEVESLLAHSDSTTAQMNLRNLLDSQSATVVERGPLREGPGTRIGPYKILQQIGEGGFGVVYMAEQERPVRRKVAIKIIKLGMDTRQVIARFEAERQALALMDHPNIARVLDAGATETGRPYFVMELVRGIPITEFCDSRNLPARQRIELYIDVCQAVQHAHQKGIIHRDIKPSNVLVTLHDDRPVPKIIDFGIAKATSHRLTERTLFTEYRQLIGTPEYMSPDQADISGLDIDTRTDIYSLGVLLYELLTGTTPFDPHTLRTSGYAEIQRMIREIDPPIPSSRVTMMERRGSRAARNGASRTSDRSPGGEAAAAPAAPSSLEEIARHRCIEPAGLSRLLRGDLDWIVMRAMEKDRTRRYQTAAELASDLRRHLHDEPVLAGPPATVYRLRKFLRRHRVTAAAAGLVVLALVIGLSLAMVGFVRARNEANHSREVSEFLQGLITNLEESHDERGAEASTSAQIVRRGRELFGDDHALVATLLTTRASALRGAGRLEDAVDAQREALRLYESGGGGDSAAIAATLSGLGGLLEEMRELPEAERVMREAHAMKERLFGPRSRQTADALSALTSLLANASDPSRSAEIQGLWASTVEAYRAALGPDNRTTVTQLCEYSTWLHNTGRSTEALPLLVEAVERGRRVLGGTDLTLFLTINALAQHRLLHQQDLGSTIPLVEELLQICRNIFGAGHLSGYSIQLQLISLYMQAGEADVVEQALRAYLDDRRGSGGSSASIILLLEQQTWSALSGWAADHLDLTREFLFTMLRDVRTVTSATSMDRVKALDRAATWLETSGFDDDAAAIWREKLVVLEGLERADPAGRAATLIALSGVLMKLERAQEAEPLLRECLEIRSETLGQEDWLIASARSSLGACLTAQKRFEEAEPLLLQGYQGLMATLLAPPQRRSEARDRLVRLYEEWGKPEKAAEYR